MSAEQKHIDLYEIAAEVCADADCELIEPTEVADVVCYVPAKSLVDSIEEAEWRLADDRFQTRDISRAIRINLDEWEPYDADYPTREDLRVALAANQIAYGPFLTYEAEDPE